MIVTTSMMSICGARRFPVVRKNHLQQNVSSENIVKMPSTCLRAVSKERNVRANAVGIFMSTSTGNTDNVAERIKAHLVSRWTNHANHTQPTSTGVLTCYILTNTYSDIT